MSGISELRARLRRYLEAALEVVFPDQECPNCGGYGFPDQFCMLCGKLDIRDEDEIEDAYNAWLKEED